MVGGCREAGRGRSPPRLRPWMGRSSRQFDNAAHDSSAPVAVIKVVGTISSGPEAMTSSASPLTYWAWRMVTGRRVIHGPWPQADVAATSDRSMAGNPCRMPGRPSRPRTGAGRIVIMVSSSMTRRRHLAGRCEADRGESRVQPVLRHGCHRDSLMESETRTLCHHPDLCPRSVITSCVQQLSILFKQ